MESDVAPDPVEIGLFRPIGQVTGTHPFARHLEQTAPRFHAPYLPAASAYLSPEGPQWNQDVDQLSTSIWGESDEIYPVISDPYI